METIRYFDVGLTDVNTSVVQQHLDLDPALPFRVRMEEVQKWLQGVVDSRVLELTLVIAAPIAEKNNG